MQHELKTEASLEDADKIMRIVTRAADIQDKFRDPREPPVNRLQVALSLTVCHLNGCPLDLDKLLTAPPVTLGHDVFGIHNLLDRETGKLPETFSPRCAL